MGESFVAVLLLGFAGFVVWSALQPRYAFQIRIEAGRPLLRQGTVTKSFLGRVAAVCEEGGIVHGWIGGVRLRGRVALRFSREFPPGLQQRLRNEWQLR
jgi:hypothetical protein